MRNMRENLIVRTTSLAMHIVKEYIEEGDIAVDCTMGNGFDTLALAEAVGSTGKVYAFDIQMHALENTAAILEEHGMSARAKLVHDSHSKLDEYLSDLRGDISAFVFNLGYMPGENKEIVTQSDSTLCAVKQALSLVKTGGIVSVVVYRGHDAGANEADVLGRFFNELSSKDYHVAFIEMTNQTKKAPAMYLVTPKTDKK